jgi:transcription termination/antitermination protein NusG
MIPQRHSPPTQPRPLPRPGVPIAAEPSDPEIGAGDRSSLLHPATPRWHILQTRARQEKAVAALLHDSPSTPFLPVFRRVMHYGHRRRTVEIPLFSGYIFVWGFLEQAFQAIGSRRIVRTLPVSDQRTLAHELRQLQRAMAGEAQFSPYRYLERGMRVRVTSGPFKDIEGLVDGDVLNNRLILQIRTLGRATSLEIDACLLARIDD